MIPLISRPVQLSFRCNDRHRVQSYSCYTDLHTGSDPFITTHLHQGPQFTQTTQYLLTWTTQTSRAVKQITFTHIKKTASENNIINTPTPTCSKLGPDRIKYTKLETERRTRRGFIPPTESYHGFIPLTFLDWIGSEHSPCPLKTDDTHSSHRSFQPRPTSVRPGPQSSFWSRDHLHTLRSRTRFVATVPRRGRLLLRRGPARAPRPVPPGPCATSHGRQ